MKKILDEIITALSSIQLSSIKSTAEMIDTLASSLQEKGDYCWEKYYPIAIVHTKERIKEENIQRALLQQGILGNDGFTETKVARNACSQIATIAPQYIQQVGMMVFGSHEKNNTIEFTPKRPHDFWKKLSSSEGMEAMVEMEYVGAMDSAQIEYELREVIRKRKENSALKDVGFIWIAAVTQGDEAQGVFDHYFHKNYTEVQSPEGKGSYWIGYSHTLRDVSMRTFYVS